MASELDQVLAQYPNCKPIGASSGQKKVYLVDDPAEGQFVLKVVISPFPGAFKRIEREVQVLQSIDSPYYPKVYEIEQLSPTCTTIKEEYIDSKALSQYLADYSSPLAALELILEISNGLTILWNRNIVHRDIKPDNVLIRPDGRPVIIDLGIARVLDMQTLTHPMGPSPLTPSYAAPEQLRNSKVEIDHRTDQFILGIVLLQLLLSGKHPFHPGVVGAGHDLVDNILNDRWSKGSLKSPDLLPLEGLIQRMLANQPHRRFRSPEIFVAAIEKGIGEYR